MEVDNVDSISERSGSSKRSDYVKKGVRIQQVSLVTAQLVGDDKENVVKQARNEILR